MTKALILAAVLSFAASKGCNQPPATAHGMKLHWNASATPSVTYKVYRATGQAALFQPISGNLQTITYLDQTIVRGATYRYVVRAVRQGVESSDSNVFIATIP